MKIVLMYLGRTGAGPVYSLEFARSLVYEGAEVLCIVSSYAKNVQEWKEVQRELLSTERFQLVFVKTFTSGLGFLLNTFCVSRFFQIIKVINAFKPDIALATMIHPWHIIIFNLLRKRVLRIKVIHDVSPHSGENSFPAKVLSWLDLNTTDKWVTLTEYSKKCLVGMGKDSEKIRVIPHAHFGYYNKFSTKNETSVIHNRIAFFGRIHRYKGVDTLLSAYELVLPNLPKIKLLVAGQGDLSEFDLKKEGIEVLNRWILDEEVTTLLSSVDVVVLPYNEASQSGVVPLAFSMGKPVIVTNVGGLSEQVPQTCGFVVRPNAPEEIAALLVSLYKEPEKLLRMGHSAYQYAYDKLSWKYSARSFLQFCQE